MADYTPTTEDVRLVWSAFHVRAEGLVRHAAMKANESFARWLAEHDRQVLADRLDEASIAQGLDRACAYHDLYHGSNAPAGATVKAEAIEANKEERVALVWHGGGLGYRCPECYLFVTYSKSDQPRYCPRCRQPDPPLDERITAALIDEGFDETDASNGTRAILAVLGVPVTGCQFGAADADDRRETASQKHIRRIVRYGPSSP